MRKLLIFGILGLMVIFGGCASQQDTGQQNPSNSGPVNTQAPQNTSDPRIGQKTADFTLSDLSGKNVSLSDYKGKKVLLNFWATWCPPCNMEMPFIQKLSDGANAGGYAVLAVNIGEDKDLVKNFLKQKGYSFYTVIDQSQKVSEMYMVANIPTTFFIDENGVIKNVHVGVLDEGETKTFLGIK